MRGAWQIHWIEDLLSDHALLTRDIDNLVILEFRMAAQTSVAVVAEKPSVARDIAKVLNATARGEGYLHGNGYIVTWAIGHLVMLAQPHEIRPEWRSWRRDLLPMLPGSWPLVVGEDTRGQFEVVRKILTSPRVTGIVCATDAGREGELIFRYIYEAAGCDKSVQRLWISSLTPEAIREGFSKLRAGLEYDNLADAARGRSRADWLVGMNLSRAYTLGCNEEFSVGRVQTPTLAMLVERELAIRSFVPEDYLNVVATFSPREGDGAQAARRGIKEKTDSADLAAARESVVRDAVESYEGTWFRPQVEPLDAAMKLPPDAEEAKSIVERVRTGAARIDKIEAQTRRMAPPLLYDLTELQRHANRLYGFSAQRTLEIAQALYERHKLITYPRTDSRYLSMDVSRTLPKVIAAISSGYQGLIAPGTGERPLSRRFVDDAKVSDHHAIIPTGVSPARAALEGDERKIFDLICRRLLSAWHEDHIWSVTTVITLVLSGDAPVEDRFYSNGTAVQQVGWKVLDIAGGRKAERKKGSADAGEEPAGEEGQKLPPDLAQGQPQRVVDVETVEKKTRPPKRLTDATLLTAMETAGKTLDDKELSDAMRDSGLGTPATRAQIIELLLKRGFIERRGKSLEATNKGIRLIEVVHPEVKSPAMTGQWEAYLRRIEHGQASLAPFIAGIEDYVREVVGKVAQGRAETPPAVVRDSAPAPAHQPLTRRDFPPGSLDEVLRERFRYESFRPNQETICRTVTSGRDVLVVMPTGSGKSLCYQLPGAVLGGTTLVVSPLIALMEDQVAKLRSLGFAADRIHSNRDRGASRDVCFAYLEGKLDFLFIAPERLRVRGFPEMLAKRKPSLIAIDEAHCISQWGHDFRPDYRTIGQHLPALRPAPVVALTATATPLVQHDIARQLGLATPEHFIHGFRRENLAIELVKAPPAARFALAREVLENPEHRPAIVYTPTRRDSESLAMELRRNFASAAYHAGLDGRVREQVQKDFLEGRLEVVVATIAFGMGIDKPDIRTVIHTALPGSVEGYYQEIGRAGRDGLLSRAILMHAYADRRTHDYFFERDYPEVTGLTRIFDQLTPAPQSRDAIFAKSRMTGEEFNIALEKLWIHGGAVMDYEENLSRGVNEWRELYLAQREHKMAQFEKMLSFCEGPCCRMLALVRYFGDTTDSQRRCGICDFCKPDASIALRFRALAGWERSHVERMLDVVKGNDGAAAGRVYALASGSAALDRRTFEELLSGMARWGLVEVIDTSFEKDGKRIEFRKVRLTRAGREPEAAGAVKIPEEIESIAKPRKRKASKGRAKSGAAGRGRSSVALRTGSGGAQAALKAWRLAEAKKKGVPAFRILTDRVLDAVVSERPRSAAELLRISGIGRTVVEKYGSEILRVLAASG